MKVILVNGHLDPYIRHNYANQITDCLDKLSNNTAIINKKWVNHNEDGELLDNEIIELIKESYIEDDFDYFIYSIDKEMNTDKFKNRILNLTNVNNNDLYILSPSDGIYGINKLKEYIINNC